MSSLCPIFSLTHFSEGKGKYLVHNIEALLFNPTRAEKVYKSKTDKIN